MKYSIKLFFMFIIIALYQSCGGAGGAKDINSPLNFGPEAPAEVDLPLPPGDPGTCSDEMKTLTFAWDQVVDNVTGYKIYIGTGSRSYSSNIDVGLTTTPDNPRRAITMEFEYGTRYYFAVTAYNASAESGHSNEVSTIFNCVDGEIVRQTWNVTARR